MKMQIFLAILLINLIDCTSARESSLQSKDKVLSRRKRYLVFPTGASFSVAVCMTVGIYGNPQYSFISYGLNWGFAYELPTNASYFKTENFKKDDDKEKRSLKDESIAQVGGNSSVSSTTSLRKYHAYRQPKYETKPMIQRRHRRDLFNKLEILMTNMGYEGRECILRALCEAPRVFGTKGKHLIAELTRTIFTFPKSKVLPFEHQELMIYDEAYRRGKTGATDCHTIFPKCGFSLIKLALGKYSVPSFM